MKKLLITIGLFLMANVASASIIQCFTTMQECNDAAISAAKAGKTLECRADPNPTQCTTDLTLKYQKQEMEKAGYAKSLIEPITDITLLPSDPAFNYATAGGAAMGSQTGSASLNTLAMGALALSVAAVVGLAIKKHGKTG